MNIIALLTRNEWLKTWRRPVFFVSLGLFAFIDLFGFGYNLRASLRAGDGEFSLPGEWSRILGESSHVPLIFAAVVVILLIASEFAWRTARQNVIDGLSRGQWYWGKAIVATLVVLVFCALHVGIGAGLALVGTPAGSTGLMSGAHWAALSGFLVSGVGYGVSALFVATLVRSPGAAMAVWFFYVMVAENLLRGGLTRMWEGARPVVENAPVHTFNRVRDYLMYDAGTLERVTEMRLEMGAPPPLPGEPAAVWTAAWLWIVGLAVAGWLLFRRRDL